MSIFQKYRYIDVDIGVSPNTITEYVHFVVSPVDGFTSLSRENEHQFQDNPYTFTLPVKLVT